MYTDMFPFSSQFHNANQLAAWCLHHICTHYNNICANYRKEIKSKSLGKSMTMKHATLNLILS